jgi:pimeloyl-ACP methyl ester carboxylesterase
MPIFGLKTSNQLIQRELHYGQTTDGWRIALHRLPHRYTAPTAEPILLCHGLGANRFNLDAPGDLSLAQWLWKQGHDCWVVELRGAGYSSRPSRSNDLEWSWTFQDYVEKDIPTALDVIQRVTGRSKVHWIGHSMGGMIAYAFLVGPLAHRIRSLVTIGSPTFSRLDNPFLDKVLGLRSLIKRLKKLPYEGSGAALIPAMPLFKETVGRLFGNPRNMRNRDLIQAIRLIPSNLPTSLVMQFADWYEGDGFTDGDGQLSYFDEFGSIKVPTQLIVGPADILSPPEDIESILHQIGSEDKELCLLSAANGCRYDYGHIDPVFGRWAMTEVWPHIARWVGDH